MELIAGSGHLAWNSTHSVRTTSYAMLVHARNTRSSTADTADLTRTIARHADPARWRKVQSGKGT